LAVQGILELVMHLRTVLDVFVLSEAAKALAVLGYFQSSVTELGTRDIAWFDLIWFEEGLQQKQGVRGRRGVFWQGCGRWGLNRLKFKHAHVI
jgi:hypothetical protein